MILYVSSEGNITAISPSTINQGSIDVNTITIIAPMPSTASCFVAYKLPNGLVVKPQFVDNTEDAATLLESFSNKFKAADGTALNAWQTTIKRPITERSGAVSIQVFFVDASGRVLTTSTVEQPINQGMGIIYPTDPEETVWTAVLQALSDTKVTAENAKTAAQSAATSAQNAAESANIAIEYAYFDAIIRGSDENNHTISMSELYTAIYEATLGKTACVILIEDWTITYEEGVGNITIPNNVSEVYLRNISTSGVPSEGEIIMSPVQESECTIRGDGVKINRFSVYDFTMVDGINCYNISYCTNISNSTAESFEGCKYIDPFTTKGFTDSSDMGKSIAIGADGTVTYLPSPTVDMTYSDNMLSISVTHGGEGSTETVELPFSTVFDYKGSRATLEDLPETGNSTGDVYNIQNPFEIDGKYYPADTNVVWDGDKWDALGGTIDLSGYLEKPSDNTNVASLLGVTNNGNTVYYNFSNEAVANTIAQRDENGELCCATPTNSNSAVNLSYLNAQLGNLSEILSKLHNGGTV